MTKKPTHLHKLYIIGYNVDLSATLQTNKRSAQCAIAENTTQAFKSHINTHSLHPTTIRQLATRCKMTTSELKREFRERYGATPYHWQTTRRLDYVRQLLAESCLTVAEISKLCGFSSPSHLIRAFRKKYNTTPGRYRRDAGQEQANEM